MTVPDETRPVTQRHQEAVRGYYRAIDGDDYELLASVLAADVTHIRPDMTLDGRERFIEFMRDERPQNETSHQIDALYRQTDSGGVAAQGRLIAADGTLITHFVDVFSFNDAEIAQIRTFTA
jgi:ketosteroid isomerase-like protein